ncbi:MAG: OmpA family protein, partial [Polaribacter sp.]|nr:OmpA family protein [Polaribacter sp.]
DVMNTNPNANFVIEGHTDSTGSANVNSRISKARAMAVRDYLVKKGIATTRLDAQGFGEGQPIASNDTAEGREQNRRVVVKVTNK